MADLELKKQIEAELNWELSVNAVEVRLSVKDASSQEDKEVRSTTQRRTGFLSSL